MSLPLPFPSCPGRSIYSFVHKPHVSHDCLQDILLCRRNADPEALWSRVRPIPITRPFSGKFVLCKGEERSVESVDDSWDCLAHIIFDMWPTRLNILMMVHNYIQKYTIIHRLHHQNYIFRSNSKSIHHNTIIYKHSRSWNAREWSKYNYFLPEFSWLKLMNISQHLKWV